MVILRAGARAGGQTSGLEKALGEIAGKIKKGGTLRVGFLEGATAPDGQSIPLRAALNEFGHQMPNGGVVPPRPFFRNMIAQYSGGWADGMAYQLKATNYNVELTLQRSGEAIKGQLQRSILDLWEPALSPVTIAKKGFEKPLIEHGDMINAVGWEVNSSSTSAAPDAKTAAAFAKGASTAKPPTP